MARRLPRTTPGPPRKEVSSLDVIAISQLVLVILLCGVAILRAILVLLKIRRERKK